MMTDEMGKPLTQNEAEVDKAIDLVGYYLKYSEEFLKEECINTEKYKESFVSH